ncbi:hypothetical protein PYW07_006871 [Mythimna separata]|uniref:Uncharacterized protein n=1 Tax=Mythimna separata TaxID=271217 RepID=A0AAD8E105_MYTSE|nr:hypothetical protein PYW07_006871 [Mythimna separata]
MPPPSPSLSPRTLRRYCELGSNITCRRLATLAHVADTAHAHADTATRRQLYAAAVTFTEPENIEEILRARMGLELESLQQMGVTLKENSYGMLSERWPSTDDEFADAVTTPMVEKKDLVPAPPEMKIPLFNYLLDTFQNKFALSDSKSSSTEASERTAHCQEFYHSLYPEYAVSNSYYRYDRFSLPDAIDGPMTVGQNVLKWFYIQNCLEDGVTCELETEVVQKCAEEILYLDTPLSVACLLRTTLEPTHAARLVANNNTDTGVSCALYASLIKCNAAELRDNAYFTKPAEVWTIALQQQHGHGRQLRAVCVAHQVQRRRAAGQRLLH